MINVFVTGGSGFLGSFLLNELKKQGYNTDAPSSKECNLLDSDSLYNYGHDKYDIIYHLAAWTQAGDFCLKHSGEQWINNQKINTNVLTWWKEKQKKAKLVFMGTSCAYDPNVGYRESDYMLGSPVESLFTYALTKRMLLQGAISIGKQFDRKWLCLVPSTLYGPNYHLDGRQMHFIFDLIRKIIRGKFYNEEVILWGDGMQTREIIHVMDFVSYIIKLSSKFDNDICNVGYGEEFSIRYFAKVISQELDYDYGKIIYDTTKYVGANSKCLNIEKIKKCFPRYKEQLKPVSVGLKETIDWFLNSRAFDLS